MFPQILAVFPHTSHTLLLPFGELKKLHTSLCFSSAIAVSVSSVLSCDTHSRILRWTVRGGRKRSSYQLDHFDKIPIVSDFSIDFWS